LTPVTKTSPQTVPTSSAAHGFGERRGLARELSAEVMRTVWADWRHCCGAFVRGVTDCMTTDITQASPSENDSTNSGSRA